MKHATMPVWLHHLAAGRADILRCLDGLMRTQWWTTEELARIQLEHVRQLVSTAARLPYYREIFGHAGLSDARDIQRLEDLRRIPPLTKETVRERLCELTTDGEDLVENQTGGSTGVPLKFYGDPLWLSREKPAANTRPYCTAGYRIGDPMAVLWGMDRDLQRGKGREQWIRRHVYRQAEYNAFSLTPSLLAALANSIKREKISFLKGYAGALEQFARHVFECGTEFPVALQGVFSEAESLTADRRRTIESALGVRVTDIYGCREFGTIAAECKVHEGFHVNAEQLFVELEGNTILVTSFMRRGTIFLRYAIGDMAENLVTTPCSCGRHSPRLTGLMGRRSDNFITRDGRLVHGEYVTHLLYGTRAIEQFQVIQKTFDRFVVRYVAKDSSAALAELHTLRDTLSSHFGYPLETEFEQVTDLPKSANGKYRFTISELPGAAH